MFKKIRNSCSIFLFKLLPLSRCFYIKNKLLQNRNLNVQDSARIFSSVQLFGTENISIGEDTFIGHETLITGSCDSKIIIKNYVDISHRVTISTGTHEIDMNKKHTAGKGIYKDIIINDGVWIGMNAIILPGVSIGKKSIVAAGSIVHEDVPEYSIVAGNPARIKKTYNRETEQWEKYGEV